MDGLCCVYDYDPCWLELFLQPLTRLVGKKCKRCGIFEKDTFKSDDVFDQWELCPLNFTPSPDGLYHRFKENEFNLTFTCPTCSKFNSL